MDGPYGAPPNIKKYPVVAFFGGGAGIVPWVSMLSEILSNYKTKERKTVAVDDCFNFMESDQEFGYLPKIYFICSLRNEANLSWLLPVAKKIKTLGLQKRIRFSVFITQTLNSIEKDIEMQTVEKSLKLPSLVKIFRGDRPVVAQIMKDISEKHEDQKTALALVCGPQGMTNDVLDSALKYSSLNFRFHSHKEEFQF